MYQLIVFDWDGTLMDSAQKIANCFIAAARDLGVDEPGDREAKSVIGLSLPVAVQTLFPALAPDRHAEFIDGYKHYFLTADNTQQGLFDGVEQSLKNLNEAGALLAVATGKARAGMNRIFSEIGLEHYFVASRCADETRSKPHPQMLLELLDYTAIDPKNTIMIGDTTFDMEMANNAGVAGLGVNYGVHTERALREANALEVVNSITAVSDWLLDGRVKKAYSGVA